MSENTKKSKLFRSPKTPPTFRFIESPTSEKYVKIRRDTMQDLQRSIEGYSEAYFNLSGIRIQK